MYDLYCDVLGTLVLLCNKHGVVNGADIVQEGINYLLVFSMLLLHKCRRVVG